MGFLLAKLAMKGYLCVSCFLHLGGEAWRKGAAVVFCQTIEWSSVLAPGYVCLALMRCLFFAVVAPSTFQPCQSMYVQPLKRQGSITLQE